MCLGKTISLCNKQHLSNIKAQFIKRLSKTEAELKKSVAYKKKRVFNQTLSIRIIRKKEACPLNHNNPWVFETIMR